MSYNEWLDIEVLEDYLDGKLDAKTMHQVEKLSLEDPFMAEALAGLSQSPRRAQSLSLLQKQLQERIAQKPVEQKRWRITSQRLSIAATAAVLFVTVSLLFWMRENKRQEILAGQAKKVDVNIAPEMAKIQGEREEDPQAKKVIDEALTQSKEQSLALNKKQKTPETNPIQTVVASAPTMDKKEQPSEETLKEIQVVAPAQPLRKEVSSAAAVATILTPNKNLGNIKGKVVGEDGMPIIGAFVKLNGTEKATNTDAKGEFVLNVDSILKQPKLAIGAIGFKQREVGVEANTPLNVTLNEDDKVLSEVVVVGYGKAQKKAVVSPAAPVGGWNKFEKYLLNNNKLLNNKETTGKEVRLSFAIDAQGRPIEIKIISPLTPFENEEAIRLIKNGPNWKIPKNGSPTAVATVKF